MDEAHAKALEIVKENKEKHRIIAEALLKYETLDEKQIMSLYKTGKMPEKYESEYPSESKASTYEEAKAAAEKREVEKAEKKDSDQALADQERMLWKLHQKRIMKLKNTMQKILKRIKTLIQLRQIHLQKTMSTKIIK